MGMTGFAVLTGVHDRMFYGDDWFCCTDGQLLFCARSAGQNEMV